MSGGDYNFRAMPTSVLLESPGEDFLLPRLIHSGMGM